MSNISNKERLALLDCDHIMWVVCPDKKERDEGQNIVYDEEGNPKIVEKTFEEKCQLADYYIDIMLSKVDCTKYIGAFTEKCFRYDINPQYKANRIGLEKPKHLYELRQYLTDKYGFISMKGFEADDIIVSLKEYFKDKYIPILLSTDKDILMLEGIHYNPKKHEWISTSEEDARNYFLESLLTGDTADNIKGIPGIGPVKAKKHIKNFLRKDVIKEIQGLYIQYFGELKGIQEFYKNYMCLKIVDNIEVLGLNETSIPDIKEYAGLEIRGL